MTENIQEKLNKLTDFVIGFFGGIFLNLIISTYFLYLYSSLENKANDEQILLLIAIIIFLIELTLLVYAMLRTFKLKREYIGYGIAAMLALPVIIIILLTIGLF